MFGSSLEGTRRSDLNWERVDEKKRILLEFITYGQTILNREATIEEFVCPYYDETDGWRSRVTTELCESKVTGTGCSCIKKGCEAYNEQKKLEASFPEINWRNTTKNSEEEIRKIILIKKGLITNIKEIK
jgi:hypothetical protein